MIDGIRRALFVLTGLLVAGVGGLVFLAVAMLVDGSVRDVGTAIAVAGVSALVATTLQGDLSGHLVGLGLRLAWMAVVALCFVPVTVAGLVGEVARTRSGLWYAGASGALAAAMPTVLRAMQSGATLRAAPVSGAEAHFTLVFFLTGVVTGSLYWLLAGRHS